MPQMLVDEFEELARTAPETVTLEFVRGKLVVKPVPDGDHDEIITWVQDQCIQHRPDLRLYRERGLKTESHRQGRARPDGALAPRKHFAGHGEWSDAEGVLMAVEVTSHDRDANWRDYADKPSGYAAAGIPVYLLVDRDASTLVVYSELQRGMYRNRRISAYGETVELPDPVGISLKTEKLKDYAT